MLFQYQKLDVWEPMTDIGYTRAMAGTPDRGVNTMQQGTFSISVIIQGCIGV